jgi:hypothetical protein
MAERIPPTFTATLLARLGSIMDAQQLADFIRACETARDNGNGYGVVEVVFSHYSAVEFRGQFAIKSPDAAHRQQN